MKVSNKIKFLADKEGRDMKLQRKTNNKAEAKAFIEEAKNALDMFEHRTYQGGLIGRMSAEEADFVRVLINNVRMSVRTNRFNKVLNECRKALSILTLEESDEDDDLEDLELF